MHRQEVEEFTKSIWGTMFGLGVVGKLDDDSPVAMPTSGPAYIATVGITGCWRGSIVVQCNQALARKATAQMLQSDVGDVSTDDVRDVMGEMSNMIGGNLKALLPGPSSLSTPEVVVQPEGHPYVPRHSIVTQVTFECDEQLFRIFVLRED